MKTKISKKKLAKWKNRKMHRAPVIQEYEDIIRTKERISRGLHT